MIGVIYFITGLNRTSVTKILIFTVVVILATQAAISLAFMVSAFSSSSTMAMTIFPAALLPMTVLSGFFVNSESIPVYLQWLANLSFVKYAYSAVAINEFDNLTFTCTPEELSDSGECPVCYNG